MLVENEPQELEDIDDDNLTTESESNSMQDKESDKEINLEEFTDESNQLDDLGDPDNLNMLDSPDISNDPDDSSGEDSEQAHYLTISRYIIKKLMKSGTGL